MTIGFDFDELEEQDGVDEESHGSQEAWREQLAGELQQSEGTLPDYVCRGATGRARGLCTRCTRCRGWAPSSSSTAVPRPEPSPEADGPEDPDDGSSPGAGGERPLEARGSVLPSLCGAVPSFDGRRFTWPSQTAQGPRTESYSSYSWREGWPCARCGFPERDHEDVQAKFGRFLTEREHIPLEALHWSHVELALWGDTEGLFWPGGRRTYLAVTRQPGILVSVICPTTASRSCFHPFLWHCFEKQDHSPRELVVIDTSEGEPSAFLEEKAATDPRLLYKHFKVPEKKWCIGLKRNLACYYATGQVIAHFDDDDMYAPCYLSVMLKCLRDPKEAFILRSMNQYNQWGSDQSRQEIQEMMHALNFEDTGHGGQPIALPEKAYFWMSSLLKGEWGAAVCKLCSWFNFSLRERAWGHCDATESEVPFTKDTRQEIYGWGFSLLYLRSAWQAVPFLHIDLGEDLDFVYSFRELGLPMALVPDRKGICAHTQHLQNVSGLCMKGGSRGVTPSALLYSPLASVLSWYDIAAAGFCKYQKDLEEGTADKAAAPGLLLATAIAKPPPKPAPAPEPELPAKPFEWMPGMAWTKEAIWLFQEEILDQALESEFQKRLHKRWQEFSGNPRKQENERRTVCLDIQAPILERYGFEGSLKGLFQSAIDCRINDEKVGLLDCILKWLTHPGDKVWQVLWPMLKLFRQDRSVGALRSVVTKVHEMLHELDEQEKARVAKEEEDGAKEIAAAS